MTTDPVLEARVTRLEAAVSKMAGLHGKDWQNDILKILAEEKDDAKRTATDNNE